MKTDFKCAILLGTTASGKSALASELANSCVLLSADSMCVYKELNIISAKPEGEYFGVDLVSIKDSFNVGAWLAEYERAKAHAIAVNKPLLIVGGSSFYLACLLNGLSEKVPALDKFPSNEEIYSLMQRVDLASKISPSDTYRLQRWLEIYEYAKRPPSEFLAQTKKPPLLDKDFALLFELEWDKNELISRISQRSKMMLECGAIAECAAALELVGALNFANNKALNCIGAKQICQELLRLCNDDFSAKNIYDSRLILESDYSNLCEQISIKTRQYAKRQRTFNRQLGAVGLDAKSSQNASVIKKALKI